MTHAELCRAKFFEADDRGEIVDEAAEIRPRLPEPERRLYHRDDAGLRHRFVIGRGAGDHMRVGFDEH